ncbi:MAG TPA: tetratricopeptide repeat protein [Methanoregulaceae archaeon]|nr:tetratricopeptide repeat protein [Methanoregulaceae archaeon]
MWDKEHRVMVLGLAALLVFSLIPAVFAENGNLVGASRTTPVTAAEWNALGGTYVNEGRYDLAIGAFDQAIAIEPRYARAYFNKGQALAKLGRHEEAIAAYEKAIELDPGLKGVAGEFLAASEAAVYPQIPSGSLLNGFYQSGWKYLEVDNRYGNHDVVVAFTPFTTRTVATTAVYVKKGYSHMFYQVIPPGTYEVFIAYGSKWNAEQNRFDENAGYLRWQLPQSFDNMAGYTMTFVSQQIHPSWYYNNLEYIEQDTFPKI